MHQRLVVLAIVSVLELCAPSLPGQFGNGGNGDIETSPMAVGSTFTLTVTGGAGQPFGVYGSGAPGPTLIPGFGMISLDLASPDFGVLFQGILPPSGIASISAAIPNDPMFLALVLYIQGYVLDPGHPTGVALTRGIRIDFESPDSFVALPPLSTPRNFATADALKDGRVFVAGGGNGTLFIPGATTTTEIYQPFTRTWTPGPSMAVERAHHASAVLNDGRVLLCGGTNTAGTVTPSCEIYDPATDTFASAASMGFPRAGFAATTILDGRVLVTGGTNTFVPGGGLGGYENLVNGAQWTGEVYDPANDTWTSCGNPMAVARFLHTQTRLADGRVACIAGAASAGGVGAISSSGNVGIFDPATNLFTAGASITARWGHRATLMSNGEIFIGGGIVTGGPPFAQPIVTPTCLKGNPTATSWSSAGSVTTGVAQHGQVLLKNGKCHLSGGFTGATPFSNLSQCETRVAGGTLLTATSPLPVARAYHLAVRLQDGSILISGGIAGGATTTSLLYTPAP